MIENFTLDTDANPQNMNMLIEGINKNEEDISGLKTSVEGVSSQIGQLSNTRGYSNIPIITTDILLKNTNGWCRGINIPNAPIQNTWVFYMTVIMGDSFPWGYGFVRAYDYENKKEYINYKMTSGWEGWREIPTVNNISNPNLLINGDFQIWQRGNNIPVTQTVGIYTADRWKLLSSNARLEKLTKGARLTTGVYGVVLQQIIEDLTTIGHLTLSARIKAPLGTTFAFGLGSVNSSTFDTMVGTGEYVTYKKTINLTSRDGSYLSVIPIWNPSTIGDIDVEYVKLELGEIATPLSPRSYGEELALCQRYCKTGNLIGIAYNIEASNILFFIPLPKELRTNPTLIQGDMAVYANNGVHQAGFTFSNIIRTENGIYLIATKLTHGLTIANSPYLYSSTAIFDSEIY